jgi:hypothetical protein
VPFIKQTHATTQTRSAHKSLPGDGGEPSIVFTVVEGEFRFYLLLEALLAAARRLRKMVLPLMTLNYKIKFQIYLKSMKICNISYM